MVARTAPAYRGTRFAPCDAGQLPRPDRVCGRIRQWWLGAPSLEVVPHGPFDAERLTRCKPFVPRLPPAQFDANF